MRKSSRRVLALARDRGEIGADDVAAALGCQRHSAYSLLERLEEQHYLESRRVRRFRGSRKVYAIEDTLRGSTLIQEM